MQARLAMHLGSRPAMPQWRLRYVLCAHLSLRDMYCAEHERNRGPGHAKLSRCARSPVSPGNKMPTDDLILGEHKQLRGGRGFGSWLWPGGQGRRKCRRRTAEVHPSQSCDQLQAQALSLPCYPSRRTAIEYLWAHAPYSITAGFFRLPFFHD
ncbi:hypothetical protein FA95DRAFT_123395 [Auriscalpium vulgare]|uniref:Uncharacterized protein n=1 Tax=Auriscalpium vulgare TaxID=40419 RepID=A0ACB8RNG4_9AGAM|nr:hypothetical protein FA95DRAFT_123395 [Auriscalpium vulgare]